MNSIIHITKIFNSSGFSRRTNVKYGDRFTGTIARDNYIMNQIATNDTHNNDKLATEIQTNGIGTIKKVQEKDDEMTDNVLKENGGEKTIHFNENAEVVSNTSKHDDSSGEEDATSL